MPAEPADDDRPGSGPRSRVRSGRRAARRSVWRSRSGSGAGSSRNPAPDPVFEQTLRELFDRATQSVTAPPGLAARVCTPVRPGRPGRRMALALGAVVLATSGVILGSVTVVRDLIPDRGVYSIASADGSTSPGPGTGVVVHPDAAATSATAAPPLVSTPPVLSAPQPSYAQPDQATIDEITTAFTEAFDASGDIDAGLAYVEGGKGYHDMAVQWRQRYPGVAASLKVSPENIRLTASDQATVSLLITHSDPTLGAKWGYQIRREANAVRVAGRWLVSASTYSFLVGTS
ncbi:hypothetical protein CcI49_33090 [Frankia sp. CcI49]|uniref:hypothetical protein n=1 Tax=unclassified Frankia TaxID=2632575 RepID=UPI0006CA1604|nr:MULTISPECIES: hypothetical protein [unclassified Frankia]ONH52957.1 hypothetical protein CcI49_33090 [Frankia sp. CcI49]